MRAHRRQARVRADQQIVEHAQVAEDATVLEGAGEAECGNSLRREAGDRRARRMSTLPASGDSRPVTRLNTVVLPAPFGPMMLTSSPEATTDRARRPR